VSATKKVSPDALAALVDKAEAEDKYEAHGVTWARRPQSFYAGELGVYPNTIGKRIADGPFVKLVKSIEGGGTITLLRTGEAPASLSDDYAKRVMIKLWNAAEDKIDKPDKLMVSQHGGRCLWGFAKDIRVNIGDKMGWPAETSRELAIATFKYVIFNWTAVAGTVKTVAHMIPGYKPRFWKFINLPTLARFSEVAVYAYVMHVQFDKPKMPAGLECLADMNVSAKLLNHIDGLIAAGGCET
jgi:hypothetical protein